MKDFKLSESIERWLSKQCHNNPWIILTVFQSYKLLLSFLFTHTHTKSVKLLADLRSHQMQTGLLTEGTAGHSQVWRWGCDLSMDGLKLMFEEEKVFIDPINSPKKKKPNVFLQEHHWDYRDFFFLLLFCSQRAKDVTLQSFNPREMTKGHEAAAVLWANINPDAESMIGVLVLAVWCRCC